MATSVEATSATNGVDAHINGNADEQQQQQQQQQHENGGAANGSAKKGEYVEGIIYPPPDIRSIVDKTAAFTAKNANPASFEDKIRQRQSSDKRFSFINDDDAYHAYYQHRVQFYRDGGTDDAKSGAAGAEGAAAAASKAIAGAAAEMADEGRPTVPQPRPYEFINIGRPPMAPVDHDILKLTALFTARNGRGFTTELSGRESTNYQFDFLRPSHSLFGYFNRLVEQYTRVLMAPEESLKLLDLQSGHTAEYDPLLHTDDKRKAIARREIMKTMHNRVEWQKYDNARRQAEDTAAEEERIAFASIDWQDFIVVATIDFTEQDEILDLPPPMSRSEVENMTLAQKKMAAMIMEGKDVASAAVDSGAVSKEAEEAEMDMSGDEADALAEKVLPTGNGEQSTSTPAAPAAGAIKIRKDYIPKSQRPKKVATSICQICGQEIPEAEMAEHVRIELLDPRWKERQMASEAKRSAANMLNAGTDVVSTLRQIASKRSDIFSTTQEEEEKRKRKEEEERLRKREREKNVWDGHTASALTVSERFQTGANLDEQIAALHRAKGLTAVESNIGPRPAEILQPPAGEAEAATAAPVESSSAEPVATGATVPPAQEEPQQQQQQEAAEPAPFLSAPGSFAGATLSAAPNPGAQAAPAPAYPHPQRQYQQGYQQPPFGYPGQQYTPEQLAQMQQYQQYQQSMQQQQQQYQAGQARPAEQTEDPNKRQKQ